jgi:hypothetical protein
MQTGTLDGQIRASDRISPRFCIAVSYSRSCKKADCQRDLVWRLLREVLGRPQNTEEVLRDSRALRLNVPSRTKSPASLASHSTERNLDRDILLRVVRLHILSASVSNHSRTSSGCSPK